MAGSVSVNRAVPEVELTRSEAAAADTARLVGVLGQLPCLVERHDMAGDGADKTDGARRKKRRKISLEWP